MKRFTLLLLSLIFTLTATAQELQGTWSGALSLGSQKLELIFHFSTGPDGAATCTMDVPAQGAKGIPATLRYNDADSVSLALPAIGAAYTGKRQGDEVKGFFVQMGQRFPLTLTVQKGQTGPHRPQTPIAPYPYSTEEVTFVNSADGVTLAGTLTLPVGYKEGLKTPVLLLVSGSGPQDRDETLFEHRPFAVIADYFARNGIATLRYDDRGTARSTGSFVGSTTLDFARDAEAGIAYLKGAKRFGKVGLLGHSEGGLVAFILAAKGVPDFIVALAAPGLKGDTLLAEQSNRNLALQGMPATYTTSSMRAQVRSMGNNVWMDHFLDYDPAADIRATRIPVCALNGELDAQVIAESNLSRIRSLLPRGEKNLLKSYPGLNHIFQHSTTGSPLEYYKIEETIAPEVLSDIVGWLRTL